MVRLSEATTSAGSTGPVLVEVLGNRDGNRWTTHGTTEARQGVLLLLGAVFLVCCMVVYRERYRRLIRHIDRIPGPAALPVLGNALLINANREELFNRIIGARKLYGRHQGISRIWNGLTPYVLISKAAAVEKILSSTRNIEKGRDYEFLRPWLGTGLLTSPARKWQHRRKILTPTFHFRIMTDFVGVFNQQAAVLVQKLAAELYSTSDDGSFDCVRYITLCSLDIICETAMGCSVYAQQHPDSEYVRAHEKIGEIMLNRLQKFWLHPDCIFQCTAQHREQQRCIDTLHRFSYRMIDQRRSMLLQSKAKDCANEADLGGRKRSRQLAFLDLLIDASDGGRLLTDEDIREEVDTFILGGHDTTATAISWTLYLLGTEPAVQERALQELDSVMGGDRERAPTMQELAGMRYLEACIKESLRLFPSIPIIGRRLTEDVVLEDGGHRLPAGTNAIIVVYQLHRDPAVFPNPDRYKPERFLASETVHRHPYAYIPFSAGPRNCIGQKFGALEAKAVLCAVLRRYRIEAVDRREDLTLYGELVLRSKGGLRIRISRRQ
uniref:Uncharacterized protein n=2 Tax=Anopheles albimanus TaxID=7167 RepID=A0A182FZU1_ANOAL